ncbi:MAG: excinuclease ABC subunit UvrC [Firmicutes bacterium HGW-Firmicutes-16]|nr:MAG: excinuclease ABC subunit UvrC [Firmicutes bacterium HGW-Firmicutes-16]
MLIDELREKANRLPLLPGVYLMLDEKGEVIYVGKAKALKNRVTSYFRGEHELKTSAMVEKVRDFNVIVAASEFEALVLENSLIKRHQPHYNILLRDDKAYPFIRLDVKSEFPRFAIVNKVSEDGAKYFGPFGGRGLTHDIIDTVCKALFLPTCGKKFPRDIGKGRPCLNYHMGTCPGYCAGKSSSDEYRARINDAEMILNGKSAELKAELEREMTNASDELRFEQAGQLRDRLRSLQGLSNRQAVIGAVGSDTDAVGFFRGAKSCFSVLHYSGDNLVGKDFEMMDEPLEDDPEAVSALVRQYYSIRGAWPKTLLLPFGTEDTAEIEQMLSEASGHRVYIEIPQRGEKRFLVEKAMINAKEECLRFTTAAQRRLKTLEWLQDTLGLQALPMRIEAFDISNTGDFGIVASMTVFVSGKPLKRDYRKFKIKELSSQNDFGSMREVLTRRFNRYLEGDASFSELPNLLLIDGGAVHASIAESVLNELKISLPVLGMVKDDRHRTRALIYSSGEEVGITGNPAVFALIGNIQEETHRFAIEYHRSLRSATIGSKLEDIKGVGETRRNELLKAFKTIKAIKSATFEELNAIVPKNAAKAVYDYYHGGDEAENTDDTEENT